MNLEDVIHPAYGLQQDEWSLSKPRFGEYGQLEVIGLSEVEHNKKRYILRCSKCSSDPEMFGGGYFRAYSSDLKRGKIPCGCSAHTIWSEDQYKVLCSRKAHQLGYKFVGWAESYIKSKTKIELLCEKHGTWTTNRIALFLSEGCGCPQCGNDKCSYINLKSDAEHITDFIKTGCFSYGTKFWRSNRENAKGYSTSYWWMECPDCGSIGEGYSGDLKKGLRCCDCSNSRQKVAYINSIKYQELFIGVKFGISNNPQNRIKQQNSVSICDIEEVYLYRFQNKQSCRAAERECKQTLVCGVVDKQLMPDGWTETTYPYNIDKIIEIYEKHGGVRI